MPIRKVPYDHEYTYILKSLELNDDVINAWYYEDSVFSDEECDAIIAMGQHNNMSVGGVLDDGLSRSDLDKIRKVQTSAISPNDDTEWLFDRIGQVVLNANDSAYNYDIIGMRECIQFLQYDRTGHYDWHKDTSPDLASTRKLTVIVQLTDPDTYSGCDVEIEGGIMVSRSRGSVTVMPSYYSHRVHKHTGGSLRHSLAVWVYGPPLR